MGGNSTFIYHKVFEITYLLNIEILAWWCWGLLLTTENAICQPEGHKITRKVFHPYEIGPLKPKSVLLVQQPGHAKYR